MSLIYRLTVSFVTVFLIMQYQVYKFSWYNKCQIYWQLLYQLDCKRRILLTGTPIQNDLQEFYALIDFTNPGVLGSSTGMCFFDTVT